MKNIVKKQEELVNSYIDYIFNICFYDCSDSMEEVEKIEAKWEVLNEISDTPISIKNYIMRSDKLYKKYQKELKTFRDNYIEEYGDVDGIPMDPPIPYDPSVL